MRRLIALLLGLGLLAPASGVVVGPVQLTADALGTTGTGCVSTVASFTGQAYCLDGNHPAALGDLPADVVRRQGIADLAGWQAPTRCDGNGTAGKRVQLVYVHIAGSPSTYAADLPFITQRLIPGANGVFEHSSNGKRAIRWVTTKAAGGCVPSVIKVTLPKSLNVKGYPFDNIGRALQTANGQLRRTDRNYLVLVDTPDHPFGYPFNDCGLGQVRYDSSPGAGNRNNSGDSYAMVWSNCWTGLITAHELIHTLGAVQPTAPHKTDNGHCWDGKDDMCYADGSRQKQHLVCHKADDFRLLDCNGDDYFSLSPKPGSYLASHWNSASSPFLIDSKPKPLPTPPGKPAVTTSVVDPTHLRVSWTPGVTKRGAVTSWTVSMSPTDVFETGSDGHGVYVNLLATLKTVGAKVRSVVVPVKANVLYGIAVYATNASGDGTPSATMDAGAGAPPSPIVATFEPDGLGTGGGSLSWTGGTSDLSLITCSAVLVNGLRLNDNAPGQTLANTTDPNRNCYSDSPYTYLPTLAPTDVLEVYARNQFGVTRVTVPHA